MKVRHNRSTWFAACTLVLLLAAHATAARAQEAGVIATLDGTAEIGRQGTWSPAVIGAVIQVGDSIRTGRPGRVRITFRDDSVVNLGDNSQLTVDEQVFRPADKQVRSVLELLNGKMRAKVIMTRIILI